MPRSPGSPEGNISSRPWPRTTADPGIDNSSRISPEKCGPINQGDERRQIEERLSKHPVLAATTGLQPVRASLGSSDTGSRTNRLNSRPQSSNRHGRSSAQARQRSARSVLDRARKPIQLGMRREAARAKVPPQHPEAFVGVGSAPSQRYSWVREAWGDSPASRSRLRSGDLRISS
jgi:hypothetical protein